MEHRTDLTFEKLRQKVRLLNDRYWNEGYEYRWRYMSKVIQKTLELKHERILEIGANKINLFSHSDNLDISSTLIDKENWGNRKIIQDATFTPWKNIPDKHYDLVIALQVFEHFAGKQARVFEEIKRVSKAAIISIPWKWQNKKDPEHYNINEKHLIEWFNYQEAYYNELVRFQYNTDRLIIGFKFNSDKLDF